jgi:hypothetical protein
MRSFFGEAKPVSSVDDGQCCAVEWAGSLCEGCVENKIVTGQKCWNSTNRSVAFQIFAFCIQFNFAVFFVATGLCFLQSSLFIIDRVVNLSEGNSSLEFTAGGSITSTNGTMAEKRESARR